MGEFSQKGRAGGESSFLTTYRLEITDIDGESEVLLPRGKMTKLLDSYIGYDKMKNIDVAPVATVRDILYGMAGELCWYNCIEDMEVLSQKWPDLLFKLWGEGQDWCMYCYGGEVIIKKLGVGLDPGEFT